MRLILAASVCAAALPAAADVIPEPKPMMLTCAAPFTKDASHESLAKHFGAKNVSFETVPGPEGSTEDVTVIFAKEPKKRLEISWHDAAKRKGLLAASVKAEGSEWLAPGGIAMGTPVDAVEKLNGKPFMVYGYSWDMWGWVADWKGGAMTKIEKDAGCSRLSIRFQVEKASSAISGEGPYASDLKAFRTSKPTVFEFAVGHGFE